MSSASMQLSNETLRELAEKTWKWNPEAVARLRSQASSREDFDCLVKYDAAGRSQALQSLINLSATMEPDKWVSIWDLLWPYIGDTEMRVQIGRLILDSKSEHAKFSYGHVAMHVEPLRVEAVDAIVREGAYFIEELNAVWRWGAEQYHDGVWERYQQKWVGKELYYQTHRRLLDVMTRGYGNLPYRAWQTFQRLPALRLDAYCLPELTKLLRNPHFSEEVKHYIATMPRDKDDLHRHIMFNYPELLGWAMDRWLAFHPAPGGLVELIGWSIKPKETKEQLDAIKAVAALRILGRADLTEQHLLSLVRNHPPSIPDATDRLLGGMYVTE